MVFLFCVNILGKMKERYIKVGEVEDNKISFVICKSNDVFYDECLTYLNELIIPDGYNVDVLTITDAKTMAEGYNEGMYASDAKYKIYMHQDVFIINKHFISDILHIFQHNKDVGMLGVIGGIGLPQNALIADSWNAGRTYASNYAATFDIMYSQSLEVDYTEVDAIDGMIMITQYDIEWRKDLGLKWDFYDISHSMEFRRKGYKIGIPLQLNSWCIHDCGHSKMIDYDANRKIFLEEYVDYFGEEFIPFYDVEKMQLEEELFKMLKGYIENGKLDEVSTVLNGFANVKFRNTNIQYFLNFFEIYQEEKRLGVAEECQFVNGEKWEGLVGKYNATKFNLRRIENEIHKEDSIRVIKDNMNKTISDVAVYLIAVRTCINIAKMGEIILK